MGRFGFNTKSSIAKDCSGLEEEYFDEESKKSGLRLTKSCTAKDSSLASKTAIALALFPFFEFFFTCMLTGREDAVRELGERAGRGGR